MCENGLKICPYCAESIPARAKVCPRCRQWLTIFSFRSQGFANLAVGLGVLILFGGGLLFLHKLLNVGVDFSPYRDGLSVVESRMDFQVLDKDSKIYIVGILTNQTDVAWKNPQFELRYYDAKGMLIDVQTSYVNARIYPRGETGFRIALKPCRELADYTTYKIFARYARDARSFMNY